METLSDMFQEDVIRAKISRWVFCGFPSSARAAEHPCRENVGLTPRDVPAPCVPLGWMAECTNASFAFFLQGADEAGCQRREQS